MLEKDIVYFGQQTKVVCDNNCRKAWGHNGRPCVYFDRDGKAVGIRSEKGRNFHPEDWDNFAYLPDYLLGEAPEDPGTYEGGHGKPDWQIQTPDKLNKWCVRECERSAIKELGKPDSPVMPDFNDYRFNIPIIEQRVHARPGWKEELDLYCGVKP